jgi:hypothetical protein
MREVLVPILAVVAMTAATILADRWFSDRVAAAVLVVSLIILGIFQWDKLVSFRQWGLGHRTLAILVCVASGSVMGLVVGILLVHSPKSTEKNRQADSSTPDKPLIAGISASATVSVAPKSMPGQQAKAADTVQTAAKPNHRKNNPPSPAPSPTGNSAPIPSESAMTQASPAVPALPSTPRHRGVVIGKDAIDSDIESHVPGDAESAVEIGGQSVRTEINATVGDQQAANKIPTEQQVKSQKWPFDGDHQKVAEFFTAHFSEASELSGQDRFFLYQLIKRGGVTPDKAFLTEIYDLYHKELPGLHGALAIESLSRLETLKFLVKGFPMSKEIKLNEPYYSRLQGMDVP